MIEGLQGWRILLNEYMGNINMKRVVVHIGDAKTGSSSIQNYLTQNRRILEAKGILYSRTGLLSDKGIANHLLAFCLNANRLQDHKIADDLYLRLKEEINDTQCHTVLISSEGFCSLRTDDEILKLKRALDGFDVSFIVYLRRPDLWVESWYSQIVKKHPFITKTFEEYILNHQVPSLCTVIKYAKIFGKSKMIVRPFEREKLYKFDLIEDFFYALRLEKFGDYIESVNESPDVYVTELIRMLNSNLDVDNYKRAKINEMLVTQLNFGKVKRYFSNRQRKEFLKMYKNELSTIDKLFSQDGFFSVKEIDSDDTAYDFKPNVQSLNINGHNLVEFINELLKVK